MTHPWLWAGLFALLGGAIALDLGVHRHQKRALSLPAAIGWSLLWIALSLGFGVLVWWRRGSDAGTQFYTAWLLEKSLSLDNLMVFLLVFRRFRVPDGQRHRVLTWGILGALVLRGCMIVGGIKLLALWRPVLYAFAAFLAYSGVRTLVVRDDDGDALPEQRWVRALGRLLPIAPRYEGSRFFVGDGAGGRRCGTMLLFALIVIELSDLMFAVDSIPAVLGVTSDLQIVFSSNVLAVLGLRALYSVVERLVSRLRYLRFGIGAILILVGAKMALDRVVHVPAPIALTVTLGILAVTAAASLVVRPPPTAMGPTPPAPARHGARDARAS
ncbi:MAG TPA: TerC/Alx family metal homeostasis membrane protein [Polyangia bacterium]|jgi:tellurite resistance protein TerC|nr:TerC/Alx family metal homeostasis membrane protein [Polyangia bacterium]